MSMRKAGNAGLVITTGGGVQNLCHTLPIDVTTLTARTAIIRKVAVYNPGANTTLVFGTWDRSIPLWVPMLPALVALAGFDNEWVEAELPSVLFQCNYTPGATGRTGDIWVQDAGGGGVVIRIEVEEN